MQIKIEIPFEIKNKIQSNWSNLSINGRNMVEYLIKQKEEYERKAIKAALENDSNFYESFSDHIRKSKIKALKKIEDNEENKEEILEDLLNKI